MLRPAEYAQLQEMLEERQLSLLVSQQHYQSCHWLKGWYERLRSFTAETCFDPEVVLDWGQAFVKDQVKSCQVGPGPVVRNLDELEQLKARMLEFRGDIEGGLCFRRVESYIQETRVFVWSGQAHGLALPEGAEDLANQVCRLIDSPFFSLDLGLREDGVWRVIELGDGQVSDLKEWSPERLYSILAEV